MIKIKTTTTKHTKTRRRVAEGEVEVCCHRVDFYYDIGGANLSDEDLQYLEDEAEDRAKNMIVEGYRSGELCCHIQTPVRKMDREFRGWWNIQTSN